MSTTTSPSSVPRTTTTRAQSRAHAEAHPALGWVWPALRIALGLVFLWTFLDKTFGLGFATPADKAWVTGASPTTGFLSQGTSGPFSPVFAAMAGQPVVDWLFMLGMLGVGVATVLGVATRIATVSGVLLMLSIRLALLVPETNPVVDEHLVYALALVALASVPAARRFSLAGWWRSLPLVQRVPALR